MTKCLCCLAEIRIIQNRDHKKKFCNLSCASSYNLRHRVRRAATNERIGETLRQHHIGKIKKDKTQIPTKIERFCLECNARIITKNPNKKYCCTECQYKHRWARDVLPKILSGQGASTDCTRRFLTDTRGYKCEVCGVFEWNDKKLMLQIDHIDGNSDNNNLENLRLLCPNCHSQTPTYKGGNKRNPKMTKRNLLHREIYQSKTNIAKLTISH